MRRPRSPSYPFLDLDKAILQAGRLLLGTSMTDMSSVGELSELRHGRGMVDMAEAAELWGMAAKSSAIPQTVSALQHYGLISVKERRAERRLGLTPLARDIILGNDPDRAAEALRHAALKPTVFKELWHVAREGRSRSQLIAFLTEECTPAFNHDAAEEVLRLFNNTMRFAHMIVGEKIADERWTGAMAEEVLAMGKIRIEYRARPSRADFELLRDYFSAKLKSTAANDEGEHLHSEY